MSSCLGIYIQNNLIKYAKISKERNNTKIEAYGVKIFENDIEKVIEQIIKETFSYQIPISVNIEKEKYTYASLFNLLKPQDLEKSIDTEFDLFCNNNNKNKNTIEFRRIKVPNLEDRDKIRVIYSYTEKTNIVEKMQLFDGYKLYNLFPVPISIANLNKTAIQDNSVIVNIEEETEVTTIINGSVYKVDVIEEGMKDILKIVAEKENSMQKAYEICKNTTVYTKSGQNLKIEGNEYLDDVITILVEIIEKVKEIIANNEMQINNIYVSGMGLIINNIDLLFQENFIDKKCEILVPGFIEKTNVKINIKDYIEVNSAISLALQGLEQSSKEINFTNRGKNLEKIWSALNSNVGSKNKIKKKSNKPKLTFKQVVNMELDMTEKLLLRGVTTLLLVIILYIASSQYLTTQLIRKTNNVKEIIEDNKKEINTVVGYDTLIKNRTSEYQKLVDKIEEANSGLAESYSSKNAVPNLLNKIMYNIPKGVQLLSIENATGKDITIIAQAEEYDQLGYFKAVLEEEGILINVTTTKGTKQNELINVTITGQLPY